MEQNKSGRKIRRLDKLLIDLVMKAAVAVVVQVVKKVRIQEKINN